MSRKTLYTLIISLFVLIFGGLVFGYFYLNYKGGASGTESNQTRGGFFGSIYSLFNGSSGEPTDNIAASSTLTPTTTIQTDVGTVITIPRLRQITANPTAGTTFLVRNIASTTIRNGKIVNITIPETFIRYVERATGHIFETKPDDLANNQISNTTIAKIYEAYFTNGGGSLLLRFLNNNNSTIETYFATLTPIKNATSTFASTTPTLYSLSGSYLPENIPELTLSPLKDRVFYLGNTGSGSVGITAQTNNTKQSQIFSSDLSQWLSDWPSAGTISLTTKPSASALGYLFFLNSSSGSQTKILSNINGLTALASPDASSVLYSGSIASGFYLNLYSLKNDSSSVIKLTTLPEKCVWSKKTTGLIYCAVPFIIPAGNYPDAWYQGVVSFSDNIWKINTLTGQQTLVASPAALAKTSMDAINLSLDSNENFLMFINKKDLSLWNLLINPPPAPNFSVATSTPPVSSTSSTSTTK